MRANLRACPLVNVLGFAWELGIMDGQRGKAGFDEGASACGAGRAQGFHRRAR